MKNSSMVLIGFLIFSTSVYSQSYPKIMQGLKNQKVRIQEGINQGDLTRPEVARLVKGRKYIESLIKKGTADKNFTVKERNQVLSILEKRSKNIAKLRKNSARVGNKAPSRKPVKAFLAKMKKHIREQESLILKGQRLRKITKKEFAKLKRSLSEITEYVSLSIKDGKVSEKEKKRAHGLFLDRRYEILKFSKN
jgi:hypothetical protein